MISQSYYEQLVLAVFVEHLHVLGLQYIKSHHPVSENVHNTAVRQQDIT